jgi:hypothetical protein
VLLLTHEMRDREEAHLPAAAMPLRDENELCDICKKVSHGAITAGSVWQLAFAVPSDATGPRAAVMQEKKMPRVLLVSFEVPRVVAVGARQAALKAAVPARLMVAGARYFLVAAVLAVNQNREHYTCLVHGGLGLDDADFDDEALRTSASGKSRTTRKLKRVVLAHYRRGDAEGLAAGVQRRREEAAGGGRGGGAAGGAGGAKRRREKAR